MTNDEFIDNILECIKGTEYDNNAEIGYIFGSMSDNLFDDDSSIDDIRKFEFDIPSYHEPIKTIINEIGILPTMWVDCVGDSSSSIMGYTNASIETTEYDQAVNLSSSINLITKIDKNKKSYILLDGQNGDGDTCYILYSF